MSNFSPVFKRIEDEMARRLLELNSLRSQLTVADKNNVWGQSSLQIEVAIKARELDSIEKMYLRIRDEVIK